MKTDEQLSAELNTATQGLLWMSESDYPFESVRIEEPSEITSDFLRRLSGVEPSTPVETLSAQEFFLRAVSEPEWKSAEELTTARRFQSLLRLLEENLSDVKVYRVGTINMAVYVLGRSPSGSLLGLKTRVVET